MKKIFKTIFILLTLISCEDVIDIDVNNAEPRLVIDASIHWLKGTNGNTQLIQLSLTAPYFDDAIPPATGANVFILIQVTILLILLKKATPEFIKMKTSYQLLVKFII